MIIGMVSSGARPHAVFVIAEDEYKTAQTLPEFARENLEPVIRCTFVHANPEDRNDVPGMDALYVADLLVLSMRRRFLTVPPLDILERFIRSGKPIVALRTSVAPFGEGSAVVRSDHGQVVWQNFDREVKGCRYGNYDSAARATGSQVWSVAAAAQHPVLQGIGTVSFHTLTWIYSTSPLRPDATVLRMGRWQEGSPPEPVAWTRPREAGVVFYTSLGSPGDFDNPIFVGLLENAIRWALQNAPANASE